MKLVRLARKRWEVLAICDSQKRCQVTDFLSDLESTTSATAGRQMFKLLREQVPLSGPPKWEPQSLS